MSVIEYQIDEMKTKNIRVPKPTRVQTGGAAGMKVATQGFQLSVSEWTDAEFHTDLERASKSIDSMATKALRNLKAGKARKFPE